MIFPSRLACVYTWHRYLPPFEEALRDVVQQNDPSYAKTVPMSSLKIGVQGSFGAHHVSPRGLGAWGPRAGGGGRLTRPA